MALFEGTATVEVTLGDFADDEIERHLTRNGYLVFETVRDAIECLEEEGYTVYGQQSEKDKVRAGRITPEVLYTTFTVYPERFDEVFREFIYQQTGRMV